MRFLFLQNGDDPVPKFGSSLLWRRPDWLGPSARRPPGAPRGTRWMPVTTFFMTFLDMHNSLLPTPGVFDQGGHDYRREIPDVVRTLWHLDASAEQMERVHQALRSRDLGWAVKRRWCQVQAKSTPERPAAEQQLVHAVSAWTGRQMDVAAVRALADSEGAV